MFQDSIQFGVAIAAAARDILLDSSIYILFGIGGAGPGQSQSQCRHRRQSSRPGTLSLRHQGCLFGVPLPL